MNTTDTATAWSVTRYVNGEMTTYVATNWNHVAGLIATGKIIIWEPIA